MPRDDSDFAKGSVNHSSRARCHNWKSGYTGRDAWKMHRDHSKNTLAQWSNAIFQGNLDFIFWVCAYNKLNKFPAGKSVFANEFWILIIHPFCFTANYLGYQPTLSQLFQPLTPKIVVLAATVFLCLLVEFASGKISAVIICQDDCQGDCSLPQWLILIWKPLLYSFSILVGHFISSIWHNSTRISRSSNLHTCSSS